MNMDGSEGRLVQQARDGDREAFASLVELHWTRLVALARSMVGDTLAEDMAQETFMTAWRKLGSIREPESFRAWLTRIALRTCFRELRRAKPSVPIEEIPEPGSVGGERENAMDAERLIATLPPRQRAVMHLTIIEGLTDTEIGDVMKLRPGSVRAHRRRARESLSRRIERQERKTWTKPLVTT
jgi:RNA polymerase sigma-70 factor (ECF subfamily)